MKRITAWAGTAVLLLVGIIMAPAAATGSKGPCVPSEGYYETVVVEAEYFQRYSWTGGPVESDGPPEFPGEGWQPNVKGDPHKIGKAGAYFVSHGNKGKGDWFYLESVEAVTEEVWHDEVICATPAPTPSVTTTPTQEPTSLPTPTVTPSSEPSPSESPSSEPTPTPTSTVTPSPEPTRTGGPVPTPLPSETPTVTPSPEPSLSATPSVQPTPVATPTEPAIVLTPLPTASPGAPTAAAEQPRVLASTGGETPAGLLAVGILVLAGSGLIWLKRRATA